MAHHLDRRAHALADAGKGAAADELLSTQDLALWLGTSTQWVEIGRSRGYGPPFKRVGTRRIRYLRRDVLEWLASRTYASTAGYSASAPTHKNP